MKKTVLCVIMILSLIAVSLAGCGKKDGGDAGDTGSGGSGNTVQNTQGGSQNNGDEPGTLANPTKAPNITDTPAPTKEAEPTPTPMPTDMPKPDPNEFADGYKSPVAGGIEFFDEQELTAAGYTVVSRPKEFVEAIRPGARIILKPGRFNLSEFLNAAWAEKGEAWNEGREYIRLESVYDGIQLVITNVDGLEISGGTENRADTEIVVDPRYAAVLTFEKCKNVSLANFTIGHTETGDCEGNVIDLMGAKSVGMYNLDIYGCGVYGIGAAKGWADINVFNSTVRDCSYGPFKISEGLGECYFYNCELINSGWCYYTATADSALTFEHCVFGDAETGSLYYAGGNDIKFTDCRWSENAEVPIIDVDPEYEEYYELDDPDFKPSDFDFDSMEAAMGKDYIVMSPGWTAYMRVNPATGETLYLPHYDEAAEEMLGYSCNFYFTEDKPEGYIVMGDEYIWFNWYYSSLSSIVIEMPDGVNYYGELYRDMDAERAHTWLLLDMGKYNVWFY